MKNMALDRLMESVVNERLYGKKNDTKIFRFDDVSVNEDECLVNKITQFLYTQFPDCKILYGISYLIHLNAKPRVFPKVFNAMSDYKNHYKVDGGGFPQRLDPKALYAGHGIVHVNHQLLNKQAQELSILISCSLAHGKIFIPPWNQWNKDTEEVCYENDIVLVKFEHGWRSLEHTKYDPTHNLWYLHAREWTLDSLKKWFEG